MSKITVTRAADKGTLNQGTGETERAHLLEKPDHGAKQISTCDGQNNAKRYTAAGTSTPPFDGKGKKKIQDVNHWGAPQERQKRGRNADDRGLGGLEEGRGKKCEWGIRDI